MLRPEGFVYDRTAGSGARRCQRARVVGIAESPSGASVATAHCAKGRQWWPSPGIANIITAIAPRQTKA